MMKTYNATHPHARIIVMNAKVLFAAVPTSAGRRFSWCSHATLTRECHPKSRVTMI